MLLQFQPISLNRSILDGSPLASPQPPHVMPAYYAAIVVDTFIGETGSAKIVELSIPDSNVSGYAAFEGGVLKRAVFINLHAWLQSSSGSRPVVQLSLSGLGGIKTVKAKRLVIQHADDTAGLTFGGQSYETSNALPTGGVVQENVNLQSGLALNATSAVLITF